MKAFTLKEWIDLHFSGNQRSFAAAQGVKPPQVTQWVQKNFIVVNGQLYSPRRELQGAVPREKKENTMKAFLIKSNSATFGQTGAGCHYSSGQEEVIEAVSLDASDEEIFAFMNKAKLSLHFNLGDQSDVSPHGEMFPKVAMPIPYTREGLRQAAKVILKRRPDDPYITTAYGGHRIHFGDAPELAAPSVLLDGENLTYQRGRS